MTTTYLTRRQAANYLSEQIGLPCKPATLSKLAVTGGGPPFFKRGRVTLYLSADLEAWARSKVEGPYLSTSAVSSNRKINVGDQ